MINRVRCLFLIEILWAWLIGEKWGLQSKSFGYNYGYLVIVRIYLLDLYLAI